MSDSQVIARKFRPQTFDKVVGQEAITRTLSNALTTGRIHHAYLFTGARGVGKTTTARILAKCLNCAKGITTEPCGVCASCQEIAASRSIDVQEIDAATYTKVEDTREVIINTIGIAPARDPFKIFIIDEVHMLSNSSFNALLKTLEEPPPNVVFIMATTELQKVPETILSRCQVFEFRTITVKKITEQLRQIADAEKVTISDAALLSIARAGDGSMRDAESALDQVISFAGQTITNEDVSAALGLVDLETLNEAMRAVASQDSKALLRIVDDVVSRGFDIRNFCREMMIYIRALLVIKVAGFDAELVQMADDDGEAASKTADAFSEQDLMRFFSILTKTEQDIRASSQPRFQLEIGLMKLAHARKLYLLEDAINQLAELQSRLGGAGLTSPGSAPSSMPQTRGGRTGPASSASSSRPVERAPDKPPAARAEEVETATRKAPVEMPDPFSSKPVTAESTSSKPRLATPPEPPPMLDEPYEIEQDFPAQVARPDKAGHTEGPEAIAKIIEALEAKNKMLMANALRHSTIEIEGDFLRVSVSPENARDKIQLDGKDKRQVIEETCREILGRRVTLSVSVGAQQVQAVSRKKEAPDLKKKAEDDPRINALKEKFHGEVIEVKGNPN